MLEIVILVVNGTRMKCIKDLKYDVGTEPVPPTSVAKSHMVLMHVFASCNIVIPVNK